MLLYGLKNKQKLRTHYANSLRLLSDVLSTVAAFFNPNRQSDIRPYSNLIRITDSNTLEINDISVTPP